jgi:hypothetical protein
MLSATNMTAPGHYLLDVITIFHPSGYVNTIEFVGYEVLTAVPMKSYIF